ncbi:uncharacterized protein LOC116405480, partial [Cucumis sativus]|uniref:uncharacterized protein LOC116405480 n=1 Tax=Cucumis sativus TaxID=3659 RepID=UPI0012F4A37E
MEEAAMRQKSQIRWLKLDDQNTAFFHRYVRSRQSSNALRSVIDPDGNLLTNHDQVERLQAVMGIQLASSKELGQWLEGFCDVVLHFFETNYFPQGVNTTAITLIPKRNGVNRLEDFSPISCCSVIYKCISRILVDRLRVWLPSFVSGNQPAFIPGRSIIDNILLCQELVRAYHLHRGTPLRFVSWVRACVTSPMFSIMINGSLEGFFHGRKGLRQGDPLSPFLFVMVMEVLSRMLNSPPENFQFHQFCEKVNSSKASRLAANMGFSIGHLPVSYLGLPLLSGRLRSSDCDPLIQCITSRIRSWYARVLSFAGRLQLVRSVLRSLQVYWASVFMLPMKVHRDVDKILRAYLWRGKEEGRGGAKVAWDEVCLPFDEGGLDDRDGSSWNIASTLKILGGPILS